MSDRLTVIPGAAALGSGFDAILADATDMGSSDSQPFRTRVVNLPLAPKDFGDPAKGGKWVWDDAETFWIPAGTSLAPGGTTGETHTDSWSSAEKLAESLALEFGLSASAGLFQGSAELRCARSVETEVSASSALLDHRGTFWTLRLSNLDVRPEQLSGAFVMAIKNLPAAQGDFTPEVVKSFLGNFGSHVVTDASVGFSLRIFASESTSSTVTMNSLMAAISGSYGKMVEGHADATADRSAMTAFQQSRHVVRAFGGNPVYVPGIEAGNLEDFNNWLGTTQLQPALRRVGLRSIVDFARIVDADRARNLQTAIEKFGLYQMSEKLFSDILPGQQMILTLGTADGASRPLCRAFPASFADSGSLTPVYRFRRREPTTGPKEVAPGVSATDYAVYGTERSEKFSSTSYDFDGIAFRVFETPQSGTVPLYRFEYNSIASFTYALDPAPKPSYLPPVLLGYVLPLA